MDTPDFSDKALIEDQLKHIPGAEIFMDFIPETTETELIQTIDEQPWITELKRRVQHYGYKYDYRARKIDPSMYLGPLPEWLMPLCENIKNHKLMPDLPDQAIINEYFPGQGIALHTDCEPCFDDTILTLSLAAPCVIHFQKGKDKEQRHSVKLPRRSLLKISGKARYHWYHGIPARKKDYFNDTLIYRKRRLSITFRTVKI